MPRLIIGFIIYCLSTMFLTSHAAIAAPSCEQVYEQAMQRLYMIELTLHQIDNKVEYRKSVKQRFSEVEGLLMASENCERKSELSQGFLLDWHQMYMTLTALQASAQLSAFSDFRDWFKSKEQDIEVFEYANDKRW